MTLSSKVLNKSKNGAFITVVPFINIHRYTDIEENASEEDGITYVKAGDFVEIDAGKIALNFYCKNCDDTRTFMSPEKMHCLIVNKELISIDTFLSCPTCGIIIQVWILLEVKDMFSQEPKARILKRTEKLTDVVTVLKDNEYGDFTNSLELAMRASQEGFGAGAIVYLRKVFEKITACAATEKQISLTNNEGYKKSFKKLLTEVDATAKIIPAEFSNNGYNLFGKLSDVVHGEYDEQVALDKFTGFYRLITGVINNMKNKQEFKDALLQIGIPTGGETDE